jgi:hypothetical protein
VTLLDLQRHVGRPAFNGPVYFSRRGVGLLVTAWHDPLGGSDGWWIALTRGQRLLAIAWTSGGRKSRDAEIAGALSALQAREQTGAPA